MAATVRREWLRGTPRVTDGIVHAVFVLTNPMRFARRVELARATVDRFRAMECGVDRPVRMYVVELAHGDDPFQVTEASDPRHLQLRCPPGMVLWHKESLVNVGVHTLLPRDWEVLAWIDADVDFENDAWSEEALRLLVGAGPHRPPQRRPVDNSSRRGLYDVVQLFSHAEDLGPTGDTLAIFPSFGFQHVQGRAFRSSCSASSTPCNAWHAGYAWAATRAAYEQMGGLFDVAILGSGDSVMAAALLGRVGLSSTHSGDVSPGYVCAIHALRAKTRGLRLGYVSGTLRHHFHGHKAHRRYAERLRLLARHDFDPVTHLIRSPEGLVMPSSTCPPGLLEDIQAYFRDRREDEDTSTSASPSVPASASAPGIATPATTQCAPPATLLTDHGAGEAGPPSRPSTFVMHPAALEALADAVASRVACRLAAAGPCSAEPETSPPRSPSGTELLQHMFP